MFHFFVFSCLIMSSEKLRKHIEYSKTAAMANKAKGNRYIEILSSLYKDSSRCIEELLQNTNDACLRKGIKGNVKFVLKNNTLFLFHNGIDFDENDLISITTMGNSTKTGFTDVNLIGKFGLGFKSVFAICNQPQIHSGNFHFRITDFEVLEETKAMNLDGFKTCIILPLKQDKAVGEIVKKGLDKLSFHHLLFVQGYEAIQVENEGQNYEIKCVVEKIFDNTLFLVKYSDSRTLNAQYFLVFKPFPEKSSDIQFVFSVQNVNAQIEYLPLEDEPFFVYYPTISATNLRFMIHAAMTTTPVREQIPFDAEKAPENIEILAEIEKASAQLPLVLKKYHLLNSSFWILTPVFNRETNNPVENAVRNGLRKTLKTHAVIPSARNKLFKANDLAAANNEISELLSTADVKLLFDRKEMLCQKIYKHIRLHTNSEKFFSDIKWTDIADLAFVAGKRPAFFRRKSPQWHCAFLHLMAANPKLWDSGNQNSWFSLRNKPFLLCNDMTVAAPFKDNKPEIFLYDSRKRNVKMVHRAFMQDVRLVSFFQMLGLSAADEMQELLKNIIPIFSAHGQTIKKNLNAWDKLLELWLHCDEIMKQRIKEELSGLNCVPVQFSPSGDNGFSAPPRSYLKNKTTETFLNGLTVAYVDEVLISHLTKQSKPSGFVESFLQSVGVNIQPAFIPYTTEARNNEFVDAEEKLRNSGFTIVKNSFTDYDIFGLDVFLQNPTVEKSVELAKIITGTVPSAEMLFETYTRKENARADAFFMNQLKTLPWLFDSSAKPCRISEIHSLHHSYAEHGVDMSKLAALFGLNIKSDLLSSDEMQLIAELRKNKNNPDKLNRLIFKYINPDSDGVAEIQSIQPVIIDVNSKTEPNTVETAENFVNQSGLQQFLNAHSLFSSNSNQWLKNHPFHQRAIAVVESVLQNNAEYAEAEIKKQIESPHDFLIISKSSEIIIVFISAIVTNNGFFVFPAINQKHLEDTAEILMFAVDNVFSANPVVYVKRFEKGQIPEFGFGLVRF